MTAAYIYNDHLFRYPEREGVYRDTGVIVGTNPRIYPKLFKIIDNNRTLTWKDGINDGN